MKKSLIVSFMLFILSNYLIGAEKHEKLLGLLFANFDIPYNAFGINIGAYNEDAGLFFNIKTGVINGINSKIKKYDWTRDRAENFYKSEFVGYVEDRPLGGGVGILFNLMRFSGNIVYYVVGFSVMSETKYRRYFDKTFTQWSKQYYIEDGAKTKYLYGANFGIAIMDTRNYYYNFGISTETRSGYIGMGFGF